MKQTFVHVFGDGNRCCLLIDFTGPEACVKADWDFSPDWKKIKKEYKQTVAVVVVLVMFYILL